MLSQIVGPSSPVKAIVLQGLKQKKEDLFGSQEMKLDSSIDLEPLNPQLNYIH